MFKKILLALSLVLLTIAPASAAGPRLDLKAETPFGNLKNLHSLNDRVYFTGQPDPATLGRLKDQGFAVVINIRGPEEMTFDEQAVVMENGLAYHNLPLLKEGRIADAAVAAIHAALQQRRGQKILFHCSSGNRAAAWLGAHLARDMGYDVEAAVALAKQAGMTKDSTEKILRDYLASLKE